MAVLLRIYFRLESYLFVVGPHFNEEGTILCEFHGGYNPFVFELRGTTRLENKITNAGMGIMLDIDN